MDMMLSPGNVHVRKPLANTPLDDYSDLVDTRTGAIAMLADTFFQEHLDTPTGPLSIITDDQGRLRAIDWVDHEERMLTLLRRQYRNHVIHIEKATHASAARQALRAYFNGDITAIDRVPTATGGTDFQRTVWAALRRIPAGQTISYGTLAARIGRPKAVRAVGLANGANPISIVVPCHRVIGANASLTGYGGGIERKRWLLDHESRKAGQA
jgi:methylated-DNA-[protein]-cysteine S-methyltransferase